MNLDDTSRFRELDPDGMIAHLDRMPDDLSAAWALSDSLDMPVTTRLSKMVVAGSGTAAQAGELLAGLVADSCNAPIIVCRGYDLPAYVDGQSTLSVLIDHDGLSEETYSALELADARGTRPMLITTGGRMADYATKSGIPLWRYTHSGPSRTALGWQLGLLLSLLSRAGMIRELGADLEETAQVLKAQHAEIWIDSPAIKNPAKRLAGQMIGRLPLIYGAGMMIPVARRWRTQLNENAKVIALSDELPEMNHNTLSGLGALPESIRLGIVALIAPGKDHPRNRMRQDITRTTFMMEGCVPDSYTARGDSPLAQVMSAIQFGDYMSYYLAMALGVDPTPTPGLDEIRGRLATSR